MAAEAGVPDDQVDALAGWRSSDRFSPAEMAALGLAEAVLEGSVPGAVEAELARWFGEAERVELILTAAFYAMVPRVLEALRVPVEVDEPG